MRAIKASEFKARCLAILDEVARTGDPQRQQELQARVERVATDRGFRDVYDAWDGEIDRVMRFEFQ